MSLTNLEEFALRIYCARLATFPAEDNDTRITKSHSSAQALLDEIGSQAIVMTPGEPEVEEEPEQAEEGSLPAEKGAPFDYDPFAEK